MKKFLIVALLFLNSALFSLDRSLDVSLTTDLSNFKQHSHVDVISQAMVPFNNRAFLLSPQVSMFFDGSMDMSIAAGLRHQTPFGTLGHHLFWSLNMSKTACLHQAGHSLDLLTPNFDFRFNYYHPISDTETHPDYLLVPQKWMEGEVIYKHSSFLIGAGPRYNIMDKIWGFQSKFIIPFEWFSVGSFVNYNSEKQLAGGFCLSFRLFGLSEKNSIDSPIIHSRIVRFSKQPKPISKAETPKEPVNTVAEESPQEEAVPEEPTKKEEEKGTVFNFFMSKPEKKK